MLFRKHTHASGLIKLYYKVRLKILSRKTHIQIELGTKIGESFYIGNPGRIIPRENATEGYVENRV